MARFGQAFINQLTDPSYSRGMFNLGATIGSAPAIAAEKERQQSTMEKLRSMDPLQTADYLIGEARTPEQLLKAQEYKGAVQTQTGNRLIGTQLSVINTSSNPEDILKAQREIANIGTTYGIDFSKIANAGEKRIQDINDRSWTINTRLTEQLAQQDELLTDQLSNAALNSENPAAYIAANLPQEKNYLSDNIIKEVESRNKTLESVNQIASTGKLSQSDISFITSNPSIFDSDPSLRVAYKTYNQEGVPAPTRRDAAKALGAAISAEKQRQNKLKSSESFAKEMADNAVNFILGKPQYKKIIGSDGQIETVELPAGTGLFENKDVYDVVKDITEDENKNEEFRRRLSNIYRLNLDTRPIDAATKALDDMNVDYSGEALTQQRIKDINQQASDFEESINNYYIQEGINPETATEKDRAMAELAVSNEFQDILNKERQAKMQRVQGIRSQAPSRGDLNVFR